MLLIDIGHGLYLSKDGTWSYQRDEWSGVIEDTTTPLLAKYVIEAGGLAPDAFKLTRPLPFTVPGEDIGPSGQPRWKEGALYWLRQALNGHPLYEEHGQNDRGKDINIRPWYARFLGVDAALSLHINASNDNKEAHGVEVWFQSNDPASKEWAQSTYDGLIAANSLFDGGRGIKGDGSQEERNRVAGLAWFRDMDSDIPCILVEFLFFTNDSDDIMLKEHGRLAEAGKAIYDAYDTLF